MLDIDQSWITHLKVQVIQVKKGATRPQVSRILGGFRSIFLSFTEAEIHEDFASELLHLVQPFALDNFVFFLRNISRLRAHLGSRQKDGAHVQLAREVLVDALASSCVDIGNLCEVLEEVQAEVKAFSGASFKGIRYALLDIMSRSPTGIDAKMSCGTQTAVPNRASRGEDRHSTFPIETYRPQPTFHQT